VTTSRLSNPEVSTTQKAEQAEQVAQRESDDDGQRDRDEEQQPGADPRRPRQVEEQRADQQRRHAAGEQVVRGPPEVLGQAHGQEGHRPEQVAGDGPRTDPVGELGDHRPPNSPTGMISACEIQQNVSASATP
jgi:hypothetical protein